jgi:hypothetical protein
MKKSTVPSFTPFRNFSKVWRGTFSKGGEGEVVAVEEEDESQPCWSARTKPITYEPEPIRETPILEDLRSATEERVRWEPVEMAQPIVSHQPIRETGIIGDEEVHKGVST